MRKLMAAVIVSLIALSTWSCMVSTAKAEETGPPAPEITAVAPPNSPVVKFVDEAGDVTCTGFLVAPRLIATAGHCVYGGEPFGPLTAVTNTTAIADNGMKISLSLAAASNPDKGLRDFALYFMDDLEAKKWKAAPLDCSGEDYPVGTPVYTKGFPGTHDGTEVYSEGYLNTGKITAAEGTWKNAYSAFLPIYYGNSGGAVWNKNTGEVIGILVGTYPQQRSWAVIQPIAPICEAING